MTNKHDTSDLKKIVLELGDAVWGSMKLFENWVEPRVDALLEAIDELERLKVECTVLKAEIKYMQECKRATADLHNEIEQL